MDEGAASPTSAIKPALANQNKRRAGAWAWIASLAGVVVLAWFALKRSDTPAPVPVETLRWGGDAGGGAPFIIEDGSRDKPGFEVELADYLAGKLGVRSQFVQKTWDMLPQELKRRDIDIILNGYEWSPDRQRDMLSTIPYYVFRLRLITNKHDISIGSWDDLRARPGQRKKRIGVLSASAGHRYMETAFGDDVDLVPLSEEGTTGVLAKVQTGALDASVQDSPTATYYVGSGREFPGLHLVGEPVAPGYFVIYVRPGETELLERLNAAIRAAETEGVLRRIYSKYGLWNADQEDLERAAAHWPPDIGETETGLADYVRLLMAAALTTVALACLSMPLAMAIGMAVALGRLYGPRWLGCLLGGYVEILRGTPLLLQLWVIFYLLTYIGIYLPAFWAGMVGLAINYSAYEAENYRAGLLAVPRGQMEAALSLGMSTWTALRRIIIPQAVRIVIPPVTNDFIALFKDTSVCSVIAVVELTNQYRRLMVDHPHRVFELGLMTALLYLMMSYPLAILARRLEKRYPRIVV